VSKSKIKYSRHLNKTSQGGQKDPRVSPTNPTPKKNTTQTKKTKNQTPPNPHKPQTHTTTNTSPTKTTQKTKTPPKTKKKQIKKLDRSVGFAGGGGEEGDVPREFNENFCGPSNEERGGLTKFTEGKTAFRCGRRRSRPE